MAAIISKEVEGHGPYLYKVTYLGNGKQDWEILGRADALDIDPGPVPDDWGHENLNDTNDEESTSTAEELFSDDPDKIEDEGSKPIHPEHHAPIEFSDVWTELEIGEAPIEHGPEKDAAKKETITWRGERPEMDGGDIIATIQPEKGTGKWNLNVGFPDQLEAETMFKADTRHEAIEKANRWLMNHSEDPPTSTSELQPIYEKHITNGYITDPDVAEHWNETHIDEDLATEDNAPKKMRRRREKRPVKNGVIEPHPTPGSDYKVDISDEASNAISGIISATAQNAEDDELDVRKRGFSGMSYPSEISRSTGDDPRAVPEAEMEKFEAAVTWVEEHHDEDPDEVFDSYDEVRELLTEYEQSKNQ